MERYALGRMHGGVCTLDCMPPGDGAPEYSGQCHAWLLEQCDVTFLF